MSQNSRFPEEELKELELITEIEEENKIEYDGFILQVMDDGYNTNYYDGYPDWSADTLEDAKFWVDNYNLSNLVEEDEIEYDTINLDNLNFEDNYDDEFVMEDLELNYYRKKFKLDE